MARRWIKVWVAESLRGTIRFDFTPAERSVWYDLLILAGDCRQEGLIAPGTGSPYPLKWIAGTLNITTVLLKKTLEICKSSERIENDGNGIRILNWHKYQSEYERQKPFRYNKVTGKVTRHVTKRLPVEGEGDIEGEGEEDYHPIIPSSPGTDNDDNNSQKKDNVFKTYSDNIGEITPFISEELKATEVEFGSEAVIGAIKKAVEHNARNWKYISACLENERVDVIDKQNEFLPYINFDTALMVMLGERECSVPNRHAIEKEFARRGITDFKASAAKLGWTIKGGT